MTIVQPAKNNGWSNFCWRYEIFKFPLHRCGVRCAYAKYKLSAKSFSSLSQKCNFIQDSQIVNKDSKLAVVRVITIPEFFISESVVRMSWRFYPIKQHQFYCLNSVFADVQAEIVEGLHDEPGNFIFLKYDQQKWDIANTSLIKLQEHKLCCLNWDEYSLKTQIV